MEALQGWAGLIVQTVVLLLGFAAGLGALRNTIQMHGRRIDKVESTLEKVGEIIVSFARYEERYNSLNTVVVAQGKRLDDAQVMIASRIDTQSTLIAGRLEAINNIVAGHTAQLMALASKGRTT